MPYQLFESGPTQFSGSNPILHRKFSWEEDYEETDYLPKETIQSVEALNITKKVPDRPYFRRRPSDEAYRPRRKPLSTETDARWDRSRSSISSIESNDSSLPASISSRSSTASPPPPNRALPLTPPQTPPIPPPRHPRPESYVHFSSIYDVERPEPFPPPKPNPTPRLSIDTRSRHSAVATHGTKPVLEDVRPLATNKTKGVPPAVPVRSSRPLVATVQAPLPSRASFAADSPTAQSGQYTAMLEFGRPFSMQNPPSNMAQRHSFSPVLQSRPPAVIFSIPPARTREANSPNRYRRTSVVSPSEEKTSPTGPVGSSVNLFTRVSPDPNYRAGYESDENLPRERATSPSYTSPTPSASPKSRPQLPRISTDLSPIRPLNIQPVRGIEQVTSPKTKAPFTDDGLTSADAQFDELTGILNGYLDEIINDAKSRGVMSSGLEEYLKSPTIMGEWKNDLEVISEEPVGKGTGVRTVSIVRRALHWD